ncbi:MAG: Hsp20 family protein [Nitrososphaerales archaeon]
MADKRKIWDLMDELDKYIEEMMKEIESMVKSLYNEDFMKLPRDLFYGFSFKIDKDGKPIIRTFGDRLEEGYREPLHDQVVDEAKGFLKVFIELPGVEKEDIKIEASEEFLYLQAEREEKKYRTKIFLKALVNPNTAKASYKNGILQVEFELKEKTNKGSTPIRVE